MLYRFPPLIALALATGISLAASDETSATTDQASAQLSCPITLPAARDNLVSLGYKIKSTDASEFVTHFKTSDRDSEKKLLGSYSLQRERQYIVSANGSGAIRFMPRYRETDFASEGPGFKGNRDKVKEYSLSIASASADTLKDMRAEICSPAERQAAKEQLEKKSLQLDDYLRQRCKGGDESACQLLSTK